MDRLALAADARRGNVAAIRALHGLDAPASIDPSVLPAWTAAGADWREALTPPRRPTRAGGIDYFRLHALGLDRIDELVREWLPDGSEIATDTGWIAWRGRRLGLASPVDTDLLTGRWDQPASGRGGHDLVSLRAFIDGTRMGRAARDLAAWLKAGLHRAA